MGINFIDYIEDNNFDIGKEFILSMLDSSSNSIHSVNEIMEKKVIDITSRITLRVIKEF